MSELKPLSQELLLSHSSTLRIHITYWLVDWLVGWLVLII